MTALTFFVAMQKKVTIKKRIYSYSSPFALPKRFGTSSPEGDRLSI
jgi:hypothetical protein